MVKTLILGFLMCTTFAPVPLHADEASYKLALSTMKNDGWTAALQVAKKADPVAYDIIEWHRLRAGQGNLDDVISFLNRRPDWPGLKLMRRKAEQRLPIGEDTDLVLDFFASHAPQTGYGARALIAAHRAKGDIDTANDLAVIAWRTRVMKADDERALLSVYGDVLKPHHETRLDMLLWRGSDAAAERMYPFVSDGWKKLARARIALRERAKGVDGLIEAVPKSMQADPGLAFERMQWRARKGRGDAIDIMLAMTPDTLGEPSRWAGWRRSFARAEMRAGRIDRAYQIASQHGLSSGSHFADLEWLSGYLQLTYKQNGAAALDHFLHFRGAVETPISLGRAGYWEGRAHDMLGDTESAQLAYAFGAEYQTSFYGLLAAERIGRPLDASLIGDAVYPDWRETSLAESSVFRAVQLFIENGERNLAEQFARHMAETLPKDEIGSLGDYVLSQDEPHLAVMIGKQAARRAIVIPRAYFPVARLGTTPLPVPRELALAIARRESEFDPSVTSGAGARGLMQLMPATAKAVARDLKIRYEKDRLLSDPMYNARLGSAYLDELMEIFDGNFVMVSAGYNAGPGRPIRWMKRNGDPRRGQIDMVDWIEHIPFDETRNYVMRVSESIPVYRARLTGDVGHFAFTKELTGLPGHARSAVKGEFTRPLPRPAPALTD